MPERNDTSSRVRAARSAGGRRRFGRLGGRILLWMSLVAFIPLLIMASQGYHCARQAISESQRAHLRSVLESRRTRLEAWLGEIRADFQFLSISPCVRGTCGHPPGQAGINPAGSCCGILDDVSQTDARYETIELCGLDWKILSKTLGDGRPEGDSLPADFKSALAGASNLVIAPARVQADGAMVLRVGHPVFRADGSKLAYLAARMKTAGMLHSIFQDPTGLGETGTVYLLSQDGRYLCPPAGAPKLRGTESRAPADIRSAASPDVLDYRNHEGDEVLGTSARIPDLNWTVVAEMHRREAFAWLRTLRHRALVTGSVTLLFVLLIAATTSARLSQPLKELSAVARRIAGGHHRERVGRLVGTEAQDVAEAFNQMLDQLAATQRRLIQLGSLAAIGELSSRIVHEMRNPLSSVKMNVQAVRRQVERDPDYAELCAIALDQVARLDQMLSDLLNYGKPLELNPGTTTFCALTRDVLEVVREAAQDKNVSIEIDDRLGQTEVCVDAELIRRALTNLVTNAIRAVPRDGTVHVTGEVAAGEPDKAVIVVSDDGPGIRDANMDKIFQPFFTTRPDGTGLGLANVRKIINYHGGTVSAENRPPKGAVFTIQLPLGGPPA